MSQLRFIWPYLAIVLFSWPGVAQAQQEGFRLSRFRLPASVTDGLARELPDTLGPWGWSVNLAADWSQSPLVLALGEPDDLQDLDNGQIVRNQLTGQLAAALGLGKRFEVSLVMPAILGQAQDRNIPTEFEGLSASALGDPVIGLSVFLLGERASGFQLGASAAVSLPIGDADAFASDDGPDARGHLSAAYATKYIVGSLGAGFEYRPDRDYDTVQVGSELLFDAGLYLIPDPALRIMGEITGATGIRSGQTFDRLGTPAEAFFGVRTSLQSGLALTIGVSQGIGRAAGVPDSRAILGLGWGPALEEPAAPPPEPAGPTDRDADGIMDPDDRCPDQPEDMDEFEDSDGCPDTDNDRDNVPDASDRCPNEAEDADQYQDTDGCPDPDNDADGIADAQDRCPLEPETQNGIDDTDGCPDRAQIVGTQIQINQRIEFETDKDILQASSNEVLEAVAQILRENPGITKVRVEGHTDNRGPARHNQDLSTRRARAVLRWLTAHDIAAARLEAVGRGATTPLGPNDTPEGQQRNRRVEFHIVEGAPAAPAAPAPAAPDAATPAPTGSTP